MDGHLVAIEIRIEGCANKRMQTDGFAFNENGVEGLYPKTVKRWSSIEQHRMVLDDLLKDIPNLGAFFLNEFFRVFYRLNVAFLLKFPDNERLVQFESHAFWEAALMNLVVGPKEKDDFAGRLWLCSR